MKACFHLVQSSIDEKFSYCLLFDFSFFVAVVEEGVLLFEEKQRVLQDEVEVVVVVEETTHAGTFQSRLVHSGFSLDLLLDKKSEVVSNTDTNSNRTMDYTDAGCQSHC